MGIIWVLFKNNVKNLTSKNPAFMMVFILLPVIISVGISMLIPSTTILNGVIVDKADTEISSLLIEDLNQNACLTVSVQDEANIQNEIKLGNFDFGIVVNENFDTLLEIGDYENAIELYSCNSDGYVEILKNTLGTELSVFSAILNSDKTNYTASLEDYMSQKTPIDLMNMDDTKNDYTAANMLFSFLIMFAFLRAMTGASLVTKDRELGVYTRMLISEATPLCYFVANVLSSVVLVALQNVLALILISFCSDIVLGGSILEILVIILVLSFIAVALGDFFVVCIENKEVSNIVSTFVAIILLMAGIVPKEMLPKIAVVISSVIPTRWAVNCLESLQAGNSLEASSFYLAMMLVCAIALLAVTMLMVNRKSKK